MMRVNSLFHAVSMMTGMGAVEGSRRKISQTDRPSSSGIIKSSTIKSGNAARAWFNASMPFAAVMTSYPSAFKLNDTSSTRSGSSSTTKILRRIDIRYHHTPQPATTAGLQYRYKSSPIRRLHHCQPETSGYFGTRRLLDTTFDYGRHKHSHQLRDQRGQRHQHRHLHQRPRPQRHRS